MPNSYLRWRVTHSYIDDHFFLKDIFIFPLALYEAGASGQDNLRPETWLMADSDQLMFSAEVYSTAVLIGGCKGL